MLERRVSSLDRPLAHRDQFPHIPLFKFPAEIWSLLLFIRVTLCKDFSLIPFHRDAHSFESLKFGFGIFVFVFHVGSSSLKEKPQSPQDEYTAGLCGGHQSLALWRPCHTWEWFPGHCFQSFLLEPPTVANCSNQPKSDSHGDSFPSRCYILISHTSWLWWWISIFTATDSIRDLQPEA